MAHRKLPWPVGWMKKHERSIVIFGALGLVGTFILKEMVADSLKDFKDSVSEAESSFRARSEFMDLRKQIAIVEQRVRNMADVQDRVINETKPAKEMPQASEQSGAHRVPYFELDYTGMRMPVDDKIADVEELLEYVKLPEEDAKRLQDGVSSSTYAADKSHRRNNVHATRPTSPIPNSGSVPGSGVCMTTWVSVIFAVVPSAPLNVTSHSYVPDRVGATEDSTITGTPFAPTGWIPEVGLTPTRAPFGAVKTKVNVPGKAPTPPPSRVAVSVKTPSPRVSAPPVFVLMVAGSTNSSALA